MKKFTTADLKPHGALLKAFNLFTDRENLIDAPLNWQKQGLQQTASGYGRKLTSRYKIHFDGKEYRLYTTLISNAGSTWFTSKGRQIFVK